MQPLKLTFIQSHAGGPHPHTHEMELIWTEDLEACVPGQVDLILVVHVTIIIACKRRLCMPRVRFHLLLETSSCDRWKERGFGLGGSPSSFQREEMKCVAEDAFDFDFER